MFPFHRRGVLSFQVNNDEEDPSNTSGHTYINDQKVEPDLSRLPPPPLQYYHESQIENNTNVLRSNQSTRKGRPRKSQTSEEVSNNKEDELTEDAAAKKRIMHREIERQRRQEMANLCSSLRSLLPIEYVKGKRSICDHIGEATRYIKDLEKNVKELRDKRGKLKEEESSSLDQVGLCGGSDVGCSSSCTPIRSDCNVSIHSSSSSSIEVEISAPVGDEEANFPLSKVLAMLIEKGLGVISCVSSRVNQRQIYVICCEVNDGTSIDSNQLQWRLASEICSCEL